VVCARNMTVVRQHGELVVLNSVRLTAEGEKELEKLGTVKHVVRVGFFHGYDDAYYVDRFGAQLWTPPTVDVPGAKVIGKEGSPIEGSQVFVFEKGKKGEVAIVLEREGGILVTCDAYQNWETFDGCNGPCKVVMKLMGFQARHVGGPWTKTMGQGIRADFDRLLAMDFRHLAPAHGEVLRDDAKQGLREAVQKRFGA